jgi:hypothetical protein
MVEIKRVEPEVGTYEGSELRELRTKDATGRIISTFYGNLDWLRNMSAPKRRVVSIKTRSMK